MMISKLLTVRHLYSVLRMAIKKSLKMLDSRTMVIFYFLHPVAPKPTLFSSLWQQWICHKCLRILPIVSQDCSVHGCRGVFGASTCLQLREATHQVFELLPEIWLIAFRL